MSPEPAAPQPGHGSQLLRERLRRTGRPGEPGLPVADRSDGALPLSFAQRRLWIVDRLRPGGTEYLVPVVLRLRGELSGSRLRRALTALVDRHEILRTRYPAGAAGEPVQVIEPPAEVDLVLTDLTGAGPDALDGLLATETTRPFDLAAGPVLRARLIRLAPAEHVLAMVIHHIAVDGWSGGLLVRELAALYRGTQPPPPARQYADFAAWQRSSLTDERLAAGLEYWTDRLRELPGLALPTDRSRPAVWQPAGATVRFELPADLGHQVASLARSHRTTDYMVHLAAFWSLLHHYTGQSDFAIGTPVAGRTRAETHDLIGLFVNLLVLRADLAGDPTFGELLDRARRSAIDAYAHQEVPFEWLVDALAPERDLSTHPLASVALIVQQDEPIRFQAEALSGEPIPLPPRQAKFDLSWTLTPRPDGSVAGAATFPHALLDAATVHRMAEHYQRLLTAAAAQPERRVSDLPLLGATEFDRLTRPSVTGGPAEPCLHEQFSARARQSPDAIAVTQLGQDLTYATLEARANQLAHRLRLLGVGREELVAICLPRSIELVVAVLAVLKAGAGYLPLDPEHPDERIGLLIRDADVSVAITEAALAGRLATAGGLTQLLLLDDPAETSRLAELPVGPPPVVVHRDDRAYVIYTSGSTGVPKGVDVSHGSVVRLFTASEAEFGFGPDDVWTLFHSCAFDFSVWEMWGPLLSGGRLVVVPHQLARSPWELLELLAEQGVTVLNQTPSAFRSLVELAARGEATPERLPRLRLVIFGGEALDVGMLRPWWQRFDPASPRLVNMYGITETTVHVTYRQLDPADLPPGGTPVGSPIGRPLRDLTGYVLNRRMRPVPVGSPGELYVGGAGVARGYLNRPRLTADRFVPDPFGPPGARLYRSGDRARVLPDGQIGYLGRVDDQVKIRGFRVEPGEIAACLASHPAVAAAEVTVYEPAAGDRQLVGYVVPAEGAAVTVPELRAYLAGRLPRHQVPATVMVLPRLPLTVQGKVDRRALPRPGGSRAGSDDRYVAPRTVAEKRLAEVWAEVLDVDQVGVNDNFFALGGDSIRAVRLVGKLRADGLSYSVQDVFRLQTIGELMRADGVGPDQLAGSAADEGTGTSPFALIPAEDRAKLPGGVVDAYPMARMQAGMVYELLADPARNPYHNITSYLIRDPAGLDLSALTTATEALVADHEILRTSFELAGFSEPLQLVHAQAPVEVGHEDLRGLPADQQQARLAAFRDQERARLFDLGAAPLIRIHAHPVSEERWYLSLTEFHAVLDGWSHNSLISELLARYRAVRGHRPPPDRPTGTVRYADFIAEERRSLADPADREFWAGRLAGASRLTIPAAWVEPDQPATKHIIPVPFHDLEPELRALAGQAGASLKSVLLAAHVAVWRTIAGGEPFYCGLICNGRSEVAGGDQVQGMFLNTVPFVAPAGAATWRELVRAVFAEEVALLPHRRYPLAELQREFGDGRRLLEVAFNYLDFHVLDREAVDTAGITDVSPNEFPMCALRMGGNLFIGARSAWMGRRETGLLAAMYRRALHLMAADPDGSARQSLLPPAERDRLLTAGNPTRQTRPAEAVHDLVADQTGRTPDRVAVEGAGNRLTYRELADRASAWAARLRAAGVRPADLVAVYLPRTPELVAALLGVLRAGAVYLPLDPRHPVARVAAGIHDAGAAAVVTTAGLAAGLPAGSPTIVVPPEPSHSAATAAHRPHPDELVYAISTSGSTGRPKGVMVRHGAFAARVEWMRRTVMAGGRPERPATPEVVAAVVPVVTDVYQLAVFAALTSGGRLVLADDDLARDPRSLARLLAECGATFLQASPTTWRMLVESGWEAPAGFRVLTGGELIDPALVRRLTATGAEVWDMYGTTEATVFCHGTRQPSGGSPARRLVADNTATYLLGDDLEPVPGGVPGQVFIGGDGLARGYLGQPALTAATFLPDPYAPAPGGRMYATGDIARRDRDGLMEILGRRDQQLKIRGFRVELGELEHALTAHPGVRAAVAKAVPDPHGEPRLAAYVLVDGPHTRVEALRGFARRTLPEHLVPTYLLILDSFPHLPNGKVDRAALPTPGAERPDLDTPYRPPQGATEQAIAQVWVELLGFARVGRDDDLATLGRHSLLMLRAVAKLRQRHGIDLSFRDLITHRTIRELASAVAGRGTVAGRSSSLLWLGEQGEATPLFCVHPGGGSAHWYRHLAEVYAPDRPVAAFEWPGLHGDQRVPGSIVEIAATYLADLRDARPTGPYHLVGWCGSSGIAWEMARQLYAAGERPRLMLIDPFEYPSARVNPILANLRVLRRAERLLESVATGGAGRQAAHDELVAVLRRVVDDGDLTLDEDTDPGQEWAPRLRAWRQMLELRSRYRFTRYEGTVDLVVCESLAADGYQELLGRRFDDYLAGWRALAGGVRVHRAPGDHRSALFPPHVSALAATLAAITDSGEA